MGYEDYFLIKEWNSNVIVNDDAMTQSLKAIKLKFWKLDVRDA